MIKRFNWRQELDISLVKIIRSSPFLTAVRVIKANTIAKDLTNMAKNLTTLQFICTVSTHITVSKNKNKNYKCRLITCSSKWNRIVFKADFHSGKRRIGPDRIGSEQNCGASVAKWLDYSTLTSKVASPNPSSVFSMWLEPSPHVKRA